MLVEHVENESRSRGAVLLPVKTVGPSDPDPSYAKTRKFYEAMGFTPLLETTAFWGETNPTLMLVKLLA